VNRPLHRIVLIAAVAVAAAAAPAFAQVTEPNGISVPAPPIPTNCANMTCAPAGGVPRTCSDGRCETRLQDYFTAQMETLDERTNASTEPGVFLPLCDFSATLVLSESQAEAGLAWYNQPAQPTGAPAPLHAIGPAVLGVGQVISSADVRSDPAYAGGLIGFALMKTFNGVPTPVYYSEYRRNANCTQCTTPGYWKMALSYQSTKDVTSYYLAFEDWEGANESTWFGNDGDFNDKVFKITGVTCDGGGETCTTTKPGVCAMGVTECRVGAPVVCKQVVIEGAEKCDNLDNDCDGQVDEGDGLCAPGRVCSKGVCVPQCDDSEFPCAIGLRCDSDGFCKDPSCAAVTCPSGQVCQRGACVGGCTGVVCPLGQECVPQLGACVDLCAGKSCPGAVCERGVCVTACRCRVCASNETCAASGHCVQTGCESVTCNAGQVCRAGSCVDACQGAMCPGGAACRNGNCDPPPPPEPTGAGGAGGTGIVITGLAGRGGSTGAAGVAGSTGNAGTGVAGAGGAGGSLPSGRGGTVGCGCAVGQTPAAAGVLALLALFALTRGRRSRAR
jgi:MYXO-CTERM domain-containing protein